MKRAKKYTVGFVGLGIMGKPMVINLIKKNIEIYFYARKRRIINQIIDMGGHYVSSIKELTKYSDIFITNLPNTNDVENVITSDDGLINTISEGSIVIDMSTISPLATKKLSKNLKEKIFLDRCSSIWWRSWRYIW